METVILKLKQTALIDLNAKHLLDTLNDAGYEAFLVGGCVRDLYRGVAPHDYDITTNATPEQVIRTFKNLQVLPTGIEFGTVTVIYKENKYEITTYRTEGRYDDSRHPSECSFGTSLIEDLKRRDFTINALVLDANGNVRDFFGGIHDLESRTISCIGKAKERFNEDPLRILRALRFASVFNFDIERKTIEAIHSTCKQLSKISMERVSQEFVKMVCGKRFTTICRCFADVFSIIIPEIGVMDNYEQNNPYHHLNLLEHSLAAVDNIVEVTQGENLLVLKLAALFHDVGKPQCRTMDSILPNVAHYIRHADASAESVCAIMKRLKLPGAMINEITTLVRLHDCDVKPNTKNIRRTLSKLNGQANIFSLVRLINADREAHNPEKKKELIDINNVSQIYNEIMNSQINNCFTLKKLQFNGYDALSMGYQGAIIKTILNDLLEQVLENKILNDNTKLRNYVSEHYPLS